MYSHTSKFRARFLLLVAVFFAFSNLFVSLIQTESASALRQYQDYSWTKSIGSTGNDSGAAVAFDSSNNVYFAGRFSGTVDFNPGVGTDNFTSAGSFDTFLSKYSNSGTYIWTKVIGGTGGDYSSGVRVDSLDNIYLLNMFSGTVDFDPGVGTDSLVSAGSTDISLTKLNPDGSYAWTKTVGSTGTETARYIVLRQNKIYIAGSYNLTVDFNPDGGTDNFTTNGAADFFISKYNADGSYGWTQSIGGANGDDVFSIAVDSSENVYATGAYREDMDFDPSEGVDNHTVVDNQGDIYLTKLNSDGSYGWTKTIGSYSEDLGTSVAVDSNDNIYFTGLFSSAYGPIDFNTGAGTDEHEAVNINDVFLSKLNSDGSYAWTKTMGGIYGDFGRSIAIDSNDSVFVVGEFSGTVDFKYGAGTDNRTSTGNADIFVFKINNNGTYAWSQSFGGEGTDSVDSLGMITDNDDNLYISGQYDSTIADFNPGAGQDIHGSNGAYDGYITKLSARNYYHINSLAGGIEAKTIDGVSVDDEVVDDGILAGEEKTVRLVKDSVEPLADVITDFTGDLDWGTVTADTSTDSHKAFVHNLTAAPGTASTYTLYIPFKTGDNAVTICPGASSLDEVTASCANATTLTEADSNVSIVTIGSEMFWQVDGLSSTGGLSTTIVLAATGSPQQILVQLIAGLMILGSIYAVRIKSAKDKI